MGKADLILVLGNITNERAGFFSRWKRYETISRLAESITKIEIEEFKLKHAKLKMKTEQGSEGS